MTAASLPGPIDHLIKSVVALDRLRAEKEQAFSSLTEREQQVLTLVAEGQSNPAIAAELGLSRLTVQNHRANLRHKLGIATEADYVKIALAYDLIRL